MPQSQVTHDANAHDNMTDLQCQHEESTHATPSHAQGSANSRMCTHVEH